VAAVPAEPGSPEWYEQGPAAVDREAWSPDPAAFEALLAALVPFRPLKNEDRRTRLLGGVPTWSGSRPCSAAGSSGCSAG
jgi:hypothetical protein